MDLCKFHLANLCCIYIFPFVHHTMNYYNIGIHFHSRLHTNRVDILFRNLRLEKRKKNIKQNLIENSTEETINNRKCGIGLKLHLLIILLNIQKKHSTLKLKVKI